MDSAVGNIGSILVDHLQPSLQAAAFKLNELHSLAKCAHQLQPLGLQACYAASHPYVTTAYHMMLASPVLVIENVVACCISVVTCTAACTLRGICHSRAHACMVQVNGLRTANGSSVQLVSYPCQHISTCCHITVWCDAALTPASLQSLIHRQSHWYAILTGAPCVQGI